MSNTTLFLRSLAVVILLAGFAHLFAFTGKEAPSKVVVEAIEKTDTSQAQESKLTILHSEVDYIIGKWEVSYNSEAFKGKIIYDLKKEGKIFNAYTFTYEDENGYSQKAEGTNTLTIHEFDGYKGKGLYKLEYEGEKYEVPCQIDMVDESTFKLSYEYYGYSDIETWKKH